jgi:hypothetical protein
MSASSNTDFNVIIGGQTYQLTVWLWNQLDDYKPVLVSPFFIDSICIEELFQDWKVSGWMVLNNDLEIFERGNLYELNIQQMAGVALNVTLMATNPFAAGVAAAGIQGNLAGAKAPYVFRTDGRNRLSILFCPIQSDKEKGDFPKSSWEMNYDFVIYDMEDLPSDNIKKRKKLYFHSEIYQYCLENNVEFSTSKGGASAQDVNRIMPANLALSNLLQTAAAFQTTKVNIGYDSSSTIDKPNIPLDAGTTDSNSWDAGPIDSNRVFYTSPANSNILDDINYLTPHLESASGGPVLLEYGRSSDTKKWSLMPLSKYFADAQQSQVERILLADGMDQISIYKSRAPVDSFNTSAANNIQNFMSGGASIISSYQYVPMVSTDSHRLTNRPLHSYDFASGAFTIKIKNNTANKAMTGLYNCSKDGLYSFQQKRGQLSQHFNQTKGTGRSTTNEFLPLNYYNANLPVNQMILDSVILSNSLYFQANGLTIRHPGRFLFVDRVAATASNANHPFDDKFLGQWMVVKVVHYINPSQNAYLNDVIATKIDNFIKLWPETDPKF